MPIKPFSLYTNYHNSDAFSLSIKQSRSETKLIMRSTSIVNTRELPQTYAILKQHLPTVLRSTCYNEENLPFKREVTRTEVGHLFEHILIEYLCLLKVSSGHDNVEMSGLTKWNWILYPKGTFHITVSAGQEDLSIFADAMQKTIALTSMIFATGMNLPYAPQQQAVFSPQLTVTTVN